MEVRRPPGWVLGIVITGSQVWTAGILEWHLCLTFQILCSPGAVEPLDLQVLGPTFHCLVSASQYIRVWPT